MSKFSQQELESVKQLFDGKRGARSIAKELGITRHRVECIYIELDLDNSKIQHPIKEIPTSKTCKICQLDKSINQFRKRTRKNRISYECYCLDCESEYNKQISSKRYQNKGKTEFVEMYANKQSKQEWLVKNKTYRMANKDKLKEYRKTRIDQDRKNLRDWQNRKCKEDPVFKLRKRVSSSVKSAIKKQGSSKNGSILKHLPYSIKTLKEHLESLFEPWMNWDNHGKYDSKTWDDNDPSTWTWQIDHIIPHSDLPYKSMSDDNFLKCWALVNLRPLSSKQNLIDGSTRVRHKVA